MSGTCVDTGAASGIGRATALHMLQTGARVVAVDLDEAKLTRARELGAQAVVRDDVVAAIADVTGGGAHVSVDALGAPVTLTNSIACLRKQGRHAQVGLLLGSDRSTEVAMARVIARELQVFGVHGMAVRHYPGMLSAIAGGSVRPGELVAKTIGLDEVGDEVASMGSFAQEGVTVMVPR
jgi:alcohol dehydrogenase